MDTLCRGLVLFDCFILFSRQNNAVLVWALGCLEKKGKCLLLLAKHLHVEIKYHLKITYPEENSVIYAAILASLIFLPISVDYRHP